MEDAARRLLITPSPDHTLQGDSVVIVVGTREQVESAAKLLGA